MLEVTTKQTNEAPKLEVPQADQLRQVREVVRALSHGNSSIEVIAGRTGISPRHVAYALQAARLLGMVDGTATKPALTAKGQRWLKTLQGNDEELRLLYHSITGSRHLRPLTHDLFDTPAPTKADLAERIARLADLAPTTAERRAQTLLSWRHQLGDITALLLGRGHFRVSRQLVLPFAEGRVSS